MSLALEDNHSEIAMLKTKAIQHRPKSISDLGRCYIMQKGTLFAAVSAACWG